MVASVNAEVMLPTAVIFVKDKFDNYHSCRVLLDSGSQSNYVTEPFAKKLKLLQKRINLSIAGIGSNISKINAMTTATIKSRATNYSATCNFFLIKNITGNLPSVTWPINVFNIPEDISLGDPEFNVSSKIDMMLGAELFYELLCNEQINRK